MPDEPTKIEIVPTIAQYLPRVLRAATPGQLDAYKPYWLRAEEMFGEHKLDRVWPSDILALQNQVVRTARPRRNSRGGRYAGETCIRAMRCFYRLAALDGLIQQGKNPALQVPLPRRLPSPRRGLTIRELVDIQNVVATTGNDVPLDTKLVRLHIETACRRSGALGLRLSDLDTNSCAVRLHEKFGTVRWQPISPTLTAALHEHAVSRGAHRPTDALLRYADHRPLTGRRYDRLWGRVQRALPWAGNYGVTAHWLRHTTLTWVERRYGYAVARAYAGHTDAKGGSTLTYIRGLPGEVATALSELTGEAHPLALGRSMS
jgi:integrase